MSTYANLIINLKDGSKQYIEEMQGQIRDVISNLSEHYAQKHNLDFCYDNFKCSISGEELAEFANLYKEELADELCIKATVYSLDRSSSIKSEMSPRVIAAEDSADELIQTYDVIDFDAEYEDCSAYMPLYHQTNPNMDFASADYDNIKDRLPMLMRYNKLFMEGKLLFGFQISKIESIEMELL